MKRLLPAGILAVAAILTALQVQHPHRADSLPTVAENHLPFIQKQANLSHTDTNLPSRAGSIPQTAMADEQASSGIAPRSAFTHPSLQQDSHLSTGPLDATKSIRRDRQLDQQTSSLTQSAIQTSTTDLLDSPLPKTTKVFPPPRKATQEYGPYRLPQPAVWADIGEDLTENPAQDLLIQQDAERLLEQISSSGHPTDSEEYRDHWDEAVANSDQLFRSRFGGAAWMAHHNQAHHLAASGQILAP